MIERMGGKMIAKRRSIPWFVLWGAAGFSIGGIIAVGIIYVTIVLFDISLPGWPIFYPGAILGSIGGASLGMLFKGWRSTAVLALAGAIGFEVGFVSGGWVGIITAFSQMPIFFVGPVTSDCHMNGFLKWVLRGSDNRFSMPSQE